MSPPRTPRQDLWPPPWPECGEVTMHVYWDQVISGSRPPPGFRSLSFPQDAPGIQPPCCKEAQTSPPGEHGGPRWRASITVRHVSDEDISDDSVPSLGVSQLKLQTWQSRNKPSHCTLPELLTYRICEQNNGCFMPLRVGLICYVAIVTATPLLNFGLNDELLWLKEC